MTELDWEAYQSIEDSSGMKLTWWTTQEEGLYYLNGKINIANAPGNNNYMNNNNY